MRSSCDLVGNTLDLASQGLVLSLSLPFIFLVTLDKSHNLPESQPPHFELETAVPIP